MPNIADLITVQAKTLQEAADWYNKNETPENFRHINPRVLDKALKIAGGNWRRIVLSEHTNGVLVYNRPMW